MQGVAVHEVDISVWKAMSGPSTQIPGVGSVVSFDPFLHAQACQAQIPPAAQQLVSARVASLRLRSNGYDVFAEFELDPLSQLDNLAGQEIGGIDAGVQVITKALVQSDIGSRGKLPKALAVGMFPDVPEGGSRTVTSRDLAGNAVEFNYRAHNHSLGGRAWRALVDATAAAVGDTLVFMRTGADEYRHGIRRGVRSCRPPAQEATVAAQSIGAGQRFRITYYPETSVEYVVRESLLFFVSLHNWPWPVGTAVTFPVENKQAIVIYRRGSVVSVSQGSGMMIKVMSQDQLFRLPAWKVTAVYPKPGEA